ncbi:MAG: amino acid adenylation domain-containing protein [Blastocatellia bacterium]
MDESLKKKIASSPEKLEILKRLLEKRSQGNLKTSTIPSKQASSARALSFAQEQLWFQDQLEGSNPVYNMPVGYRLTGPLNRDALEWSLNRIISRHDTLRTSFCQQDGVPVERVAQAAKLNPEVTDLSHVAEPLREGAAAELILRYASRPFNLSQAPLLRANLLRLAERDHMLLLTMHHIISDQQSIEVLLSELSSLYDAFVTGKPVDLPELPIQYGDFAEWQRERLQGELLDRQVQYWKQRLANSLPTLDLPASRPRPNERTYKGAACSLAFSESLSKEVIALSRRERVTTFMTVLAAFQALLYRYTGQGDMNMGLPVSNRKQPEVKNLIGLFINSLVLRADLSDDPTFKELLARTRDMMAGALAHDELPLEKLVELLRPERSLSFAPLFQVMFNFSQGSAQPFALHGVRTEFIEGDIDVARSDLTLSIRQDDRLYARLEYSTDLFESSIAAQMLRHYQRLLEGAVADPLTRLSNLPLLSEAEREQLLARSDCGGVYPATSTLHQIFERQADYYPDAIVVAFQDERLSYGELDRRANQLARVLRRCGVGPEVRVGLCVERSAALLVGLLGILKAGGAYVPLDPGYPKPRLSFLVEDSEAAVLVTQQALLDSLPSYDGEVITLDGDLRLARESVDRLAPLAGPESLAYMIYTSGSTGQPKGALISHTNVVRLYLATQQWFQFDRQDVWCLFHSCSFDFSVWEIWGALLYGGRLVVAPYWVSRSPEAFLDLLCREGITVLSQTPSAFGLLMNADESIGGATNLALRYVIFGGEALNFQSLSGWVARHGVERPQLINMYGITETTVHVTYRRLSREDIKQQRSSLIGTPIPDLQVYLLDANLQPVPDGVAGEIYVGGAGLARGYWKQPSLSASRFIPNPFAEGPNITLYRSGDLARCLPEGRLEYLGRIDDQVKIRGHRVELGEIESVLRQHPAVREAFILACDAPSGGKQLIAYFVMRESAQAAGDLRAFLEAKLPDYMLPAAFMQLAALPLTPHGKVDRRALPQPASDQARDDYIAPRDLTEDTLAKIWAELLGQERVSVHDNFFELGGDSILSIQAAARANQAGLKVTTRQLFQNQTIAKLASALTQRAPAEVTAGKSFPQDGPVPLTPIQRWFFELQLEEPAHWNQAVLLQIRGGGIRPGSWERAILELIAHHDALRLRFRRAVTGWVQTQVSDPGPAFFNYVDLTQAPLEAQEHLLEQAVANTHAGLDLSQGPLLRATLIDLGSAKGTRLLLAAHHLIMDGVSWRILLDDLNLACEQIERGDPVRLPPKTTSFQQWAETLAQLARQSDVETEVAGFVPNDLNPISAFPAEPSRGADTVATVRTVHSTFNAAQTRTLLEDIPRACRARVDEVLLAVLVEAFGQLTGERSLWLEIERHGREDVVDGIDLSKTVGWFTSIFPFYLDLRRCEGMIEAIREAREQLRKAPRNGISYGIARYLSDNSELKDRLRKLPATDLRFNYLGRFDTSFGGNKQWVAAKESSGTPQSLRNRCSHALEVNSYVLEGQLHVAWTFGEKTRARATIDNLARKFEQTLASLIESGIPDKSATSDAAELVTRLDRSSAELLLKNDPEVEDIYPLLPMQHGILFHCFLTPESDVYKYQFTCSLIGRLDAALFQRAWEVVTGRHATLRTYFVWENQSQPLQAVRRKVRLPWRWTDWSHLQLCEQQHNLEETLQAEFDVPFNFSEPPMHRVMLIRLGEDKHQLIWTMHHILFDGWSVASLANEIFSVYETLCHQSEISTSLSRPSLRDYLTWIQTRDSKAAEAYWRQLLGNFSEPTALPFQSQVITYGRAVKQGNQRHASIELDAQIEAGLKDVARKHVLTLHSVMQGVYALVLSHMSKSRDVVFGVTVSGRSADLPGIESMVGMLINTLPVRVYVQPQKAALDWFRDLHDEYLEMQQYEYCSLVDIHSWSDMPGGLPLFESILVTENYPLSETLFQQDKDLRLENLRVRGSDSLALVLTFIPRAKTLLQANYDSCRFREEDIINLLNYLGLLLAAITRSPQASVGDLESLLEKEMEKAYENALTTALKVTSRRAIRQTS